MSKTATALVRAAHKLSRDVDGLRFSEPVSHVYNPLVYARRSHDRYLRQFGTGKKRVVFLGMNPGPFGMAQTGVPFGEIEAVRAWMGIEEPVGHPPVEHEKRPIRGFDCPRSEVSGARLWGLFRQRFKTAPRFFRHHFVANYCPLVFLERSGRNRTPDKLRKSEREALYAICDDHLRALVRILEPEHVVGVGKFAEQRATAALDDDGPRVHTVLHPSPASPLANRGWAPQASAQLTACGVWS